MNFLSHFYFDQQRANPNIILGTILPDLLKNANKDWNPRPQKHKPLFSSPLPIHDLLIGWERHLEVDLIFHSSTFFAEKTQALKKLLLPILSDSVVRPSFLAHISVELLLDHLLIEHKKINVDIFYKNLDLVDTEDLQMFLTRCDITDTSQFFKFFDSFKSSRYLEHYQELESISYALKRICMRLWINPFDEETTQQLNVVLDSYKNELEEDFMIIFEVIENRLK